MKAGYAFTKGGSFGVRPALSMLLAASVFVACGESGADPAGPSEPEIGVAEAEVLSQLLADPYSVEGLSELLLDQVRAGQMREQVGLLAADLAADRSEALADHLQGLRQLVRDYLDDPDFDFRELPLVTAINLYVVQSEEVLAGRLQVFEG
jgi:hypothetical protein